MSGVRGALKEARETIVMMVERGDYGAAIEALATTVDRAFSRLGEALVLSVRGLRENIDRLAGKVDKLAESIADLRDVAARHDEAIGELTKNVAELTEDVRELRESVADLRRSLEIERTQRRDEIRGLRGEMAHLSFRFTLERICAEHGLSFEPLPPDPYRVDGLIEGKRIVALVEIARTGSERDVEQLVEGARIYEREEGRRPDALVLYIYARRPSEEFVRLCEEHGIIVDSSPRRIARKLAELDRRLAEGKAARSEG